MTQPGLSAAGLGLVVAVALVEATGLLAGSSETTGLAVLVNGVDDPVDARVDADCLVLGVDEDDLVVLVRGVLVDPVRVEDAQVGAASADTLLGGGLEGSLVLELVHTLVGGLACLDSQHEWYQIRSGGCRESRDGHVECGQDKAFGKMASLSLRSSRCGPPISFDPSLVCTYHRWHPWEQGACGRRGGRGRGR